MAGHGPGDEVAVEAVGQQFGDLALGGGGGDLGGDAGALPVEERDRRAWTVTWPLNVLTRFGPLTSVSPEPLNSRLFTIVVWTPASTSRAMSGRSAKRQPRLAENRGIVTRVRRGNGRHVGIDEIRL